jgi:hypothetical protein
MTNKLVIIIYSLKVPKIKKILLYAMKFLVPNYSCLQNPWLGGYRPQIPVLFVLCLQLNLLKPTEQNSWVRHWVAGSSCSVVTSVNTCYRPPWSRHLAHVQSKVTWHRRPHQDLKHSSLLSASIVAVIVIMMTRSRLIKSCAGPSICSPEVRYIV